MDSGEPSLDAPMDELSTRGLLQEAEEAQRALVALIDAPLCYDISEDVVKRVTDIKDGYSCVNIAYSNLRCRYTQLNVNPTVITK